MLINEYEIIQICSNLTSQQAGKINCQVKEVFCLIMATEVLDGILSPDARISLGIISVKASDLDKIRRLNVPPEDGRYTPLDEEGDVIPSGPGTSQTETGDKGTIFTSSPGPRMTPANGSAIRTEATTSRPVFSRGENGSWQPNRPTLKP